MSSRICGVIIEGGNEFRIFAVIQLGTDVDDGYFGDINKLVYADTSRYYLFTQAGHGHLRLGEPLNEALKTGKNGCIISKLMYSTISYIVNNISDLNLYDSTFKGLGGATRVGIDDTTGRVWDCKFDRVYFIGVATELDVFSLIITMNYALSDCGFYTSMAGTGAMDKVSFYNCYYPFFIRYGSAVTIDIKNIVARNYYMLIRFYRSNGAITVNALDWDVPAWIISFSRSYSSTVNRQYTFNLKVTDKDGNNINGASVKIWDKDSNLVVNITTASGVIVEQTVNYGYYFFTTGSVLQSYSPHTIQISKAGYQTYEKKFTLDKKVDWTLALKRISINVDSEVIN